jgi:hypothetical protein
MPRSSRPQQSCWGKPASSRSSPQRRRSEGRLGDLGLRERFHGERPGSLEEVLAALDAPSQSRLDP